MGGDFTQSSNYQNWQNSFFNPINHNQFSKYIPIALTIGNHDNPYGSLHSKYIGGFQRYFSFTSGSGFFIILNSNENSPNQINWLESQLQSKESLTSKFKIVVVHIPPFIEYWDPETWEAGESKWGEFVRDKWVELFEKYKVDLIISGHQHNYQRGKRNGIVYTIIGGGGGQLDNVRVYDWGMYEKTFIGHHYIIMKLTLTTLEWSVYDLSENVIDKFVLIKS